MVVPLADAFPLVCVVPPPHASEFRRKLAQRSIETFVLYARSLRPQTPRRHGDSLDAPTRRFARVRVWQRALKEQILQSREQGLDTAPRVCPVQTSHLESNETSAVAAAAAVGVVAATPSTVGVVALASIPEAGGGGWRAVVTLEPRQEGTWARFPTWASVWSLSGGVPLFCVGFLPEPLTQRDWYWPKTITRPGNCT